MVPQEIHDAVLEHLTTARPTNINGVEAKDPRLAGDPADIQFGRSKAATGRRLQVVDYMGANGHRWHFVLFLRQEEDGRWRVHGGGGGGGDMLIRPYPWVNLAASWGDFGMWAGGYLSDNGMGVTRARLIGPDNLVIEDTIAEGHALFMTEHPVHDLAPIVAELFNDSGELVGSHKAFATSH
jgi:hypothetical protein